jgi:lactoylglutathione lyase
MKLNLLVLRTARLEEIRTFYSALGASFDSEQHGNGPEHYAATLGDNLVLEIYPCAAGAQPDAGLRLGVMVDNIEDALRAIGHTAAPRRTKWGLSALVHDPDGRTVELVQSNTAANCAA